MESVRPFWISRGPVAWPHVTWHPVRGDLTAHPWTVTLPWG